MTYEENSSPDKDWKNPARYKNGKTYYCFTKRFPIYATIHNIHFKLNLTNAAANTTATTKKTSKDAGSQPQSWFITSGESTHMCNETRLLLWPGDGNTFDWIFLLPDTQNTKAYLVALCGNSQPWLAWLNNDWYSTLPKAGVSLIQVFIPALPVTSTIPCK